MVCRIGKYIRGLIRGTGVVNIFLTMKCIMQNNPLKMCGQARGTFNENHHWIDAFLLYSMDSLSQVNYNDF